MDLFTFLLCKKKGGGGGGLTYTLSADTVNKQIVLTPSEGDAQAITVPYATDASTVNGKDVPELENGKIPATYLPSYVDDVLEYEDLAHFPAEGEVGKIYVALDTSLIYRWGGSVYAEINQSLALGETEATAYRGDRGKIAYDHSQSAHAPSNAEANQNAFSNITVGDTTIEADSKTDTLTLEAGSNITLTPDASTDKVTITATDTTYSDATTSVSGLMSGSDKTKLNGIATGAEVNQNTFSNVKIGSTTVAADSKTDTLELEAGDNIELTPDSTNDKITVSGIPVTRTIQDVNIASFSDGGNAPIPSLKVAIEPQQDLHGYDAPWVGGAGKNKFNTDFENTTINGTTITKTSDGRVLTSGVPTSAFDFVIGHGSLPAGSYILNGCPANGGADKYRLQVTDYPVVNNLGLDYGSGVSFTLEQDMEIAVRIQVYVGASASLEYKPMIRLASVSDATFAPYSNICPIIGWDECNVGISGFNVWDEEWEVGGINHTTGQNTETTGIIRSKNYIGVNGNTNYNFLKKTNGIDFHVHWYDADKNFISYEEVYTNNSINYKVATSPQNAVYMRFNLTAGYGATYNNDISINYPSTDTSYHAYNGNTYEINLDGTRYGGEVDVVNGTMTVDRVKTVITKDSSIQYRSSGRALTFISNAYKTVTMGGANVICDKLKGAYYANYDSVLNGEIATVSGSTAQTGISFKISDSITSLDDLTAWLTNNPLTIVTNLATPLTIQLTPTAIKSLRGVNNVYANTGPLREVTYRTQAYGDFIAERDLPDAISNIKTLKLDENQILIGDGNFNKVGLFMDDYYDENLDTTFSTEVTPQEIYLTSQPAESVSQTAIITSNQTQYQTSLLSGTEVINTVNAIGVEVNVKENGSITHGIKIVSGDIRFVGSDTWDGTNTSLKDAFAAIQNNLYIANYNKTASLSSGSNTIALDMTGYTYNGSDIINVYVDGLYKINNTDYTITVNDSTGVASINYTAAAAATMAIQVIKPKIGFTALTDNNGDNVTDSNGNSIDI